MIFSTYIKNIINPKRKIIERIIFKRFEKKNKNQQKKILKPKKNLSQKRRKRLKFEAKMI